MDVMNSRLISLREATLREKKKYEFSLAKAAFCAGLVCLPMLVLVLSWKAKKPKDKMVNQ